MPRKATKPKANKPKSNNVLPNNDAPMSDRYRQAYEVLFARLSKQGQERVLQLKEDSLNGVNSRDYEASKFIKDVIALAEDESADLKKL